ncbi:unnamed protein product, partial [Didymodactylos carnosus]
TMWNLIAATASDNSIKGRERSLLKNRINDNFSVSSHFVESSSSVTPSPSPDQNNMSQFDLQNEELRISSSNSSDSEEYLFDSIDDNTRNERLNDFLTDDINIDNDVHNYMDEDENRYFSIYNRDLRPLHPYTNVITGETNERFLELIRRGLIKRNLSEIDYYSNQTSPIFDNDIIIGERYRKLKETHNNHPFISLIFHLNGFPLVKSTKFCLWTF